MGDLRLKFRGVIKDGKLVPENPMSFRAYISRFKDGMKMEFSVGPWRKQRSSAQNNYYWGVVLEVISAETGHTPAELHEIFKRMFLPKKYIEYRDKQIDVPSSTPDQDTSQFTEYIERIRAEAATMGINVPGPGTFEIG